MTASNGEVVPAAVDTVKTAVTVLPEHSALNVIGLYQTVLDTVQVSTGVPWWGVLLGAGVAVRAFLIPFNVLFEKKLVKNIPHIAELTKLRNELKKFHAKGDYVATMTKQQEVQFYKTKNKFSWRNSANWFLLPSVFAMSVNFLSIRSLAEMSYFPLQETSFLWIPSLCQCDPYYLLPAMNAGAVVYVMKYGIDTGTENVLTQMLSSNKALLFVMVVMGGLQSMFPSALVLYWFASNLVGMTVIKPMMSSDTMRIKLGLLSISEKKEKFKVISTPQEIMKSATENYQEIRETGHAKDLAARKAKLDKLTGNAGGSVEELSNSLEELKKELKRKEDELSRLKRDTDGKIEFLKKQEELKGLVSDKSEKAGKG